MGLHHQELGQGEKKEVKAEGQESEAFTQRF